MYLAKNDYRRYHQYFHLVLRRCPQPAGSEVHQFLQSQPGFSYYTLRDKGPVMKTTAKLSVPTTGRRSVTGRQLTAVLGVHHRNHHHCHRKKLPTSKYQLLDLPGPG